MKIPLVPQFKLEFDKKQTNKQTKRNKTKQKQKQNNNKKPLICNFLLFCPYTLYLQIFPMK